MIFTDLFNEYIEMFEDIQSDSEIVNKKNRYKNHIKSFIGDMDIEDIKFKHCQEIVNNVIKVKELSPKTAKNVNAVVQTIFNYAIKNEYTEKNPANYVIIPKFDNKYNITLKTKEIKSLVDSVLSFENPIYRLIFIFALHGRRKNEILKMQWYQVDLALKNYSIPAQKNKSRKHDVHEMTPLLYGELVHYYKSQIEEKGKLLSKDYLFVNPDTNLYFKDIRRPFKRLRELAGIDNMRFHDFRHILGTESIRKKIPIEHISQALGHSSIEVTQRYITKDSKISNQVVSNFLKDYQTSSNKSNTST